MFREQGYLKISTILNYNYSDNFQFYRVPLLDVILVVSENTENSVRDEGPENTRGTRPFIIWIYGFLVSIFWWYLALKFDLYECSLYLTTVIIIFVNLGTNNAAINLWNQIEKVKSGSKWTSIVFWVNPLAWHIILR